MTMSDPTWVALAHAGFCGAGEEAGAAVNPPEAVGNTALDIGVLGETVGRAPVAGAGAGGGLGAGDGLGAGAGVGLAVAWARGVEGAPEAGWDGV